MVPSYSHDIEKIELNFKEKQLTDVNLMGISSPRWHSEIKPSEKIDQCQGNLFTIVNIILNIEEKTSDFLLFHEKYLLQMQ